MRPHRAIALAALLLLSPAIAQARWTHLGGDPAHSNVAALGDVPLDVVAHYRFEAAPDEVIESQGAGLVATPHGPTGLITIPVSPTAVCQLFRISDVDTGTFERFGATVACPDGARLLAYDAKRDRVILEFDGLASSPILQAWDARTGEVQWAVGPALATPEAPGAQDYNDWVCTDATFDANGDIVYAGFSSEFGFRHRIQAMSLEDGQVLWSVAVPASTFWFDATVPAPARETLATTGPTTQPATQGFLPTALTLTTDGLVALGSASTNLFANRPSSTSAVAWLDLDGQVVGGYVAGTEATRGADFSPTPPVSRHSASSGSLAAAAMDGRLVLVHPVNAMPTLVELPPSETFDGYLAAPAWSREALVVPLVSTAVVYPTGDTSRGLLWPGYEGSRIDALLVSPPGDAYAAVTRPTRDGFAADLVRIDLATARTIDRVPLPLNATDIGMNGVSLLPLDGGRLLAWSRGGSAVLLAAAPEDLRPRIELENPYPAAGEAFALVPHAAGEVRDLTIAWGDGVLDRAQGGTRAVHAYEAPGRRVVRVIAVYADNRTGTSEAIVHVGATPPAQLNAMQRAFAPERQELTFFLLGLLVTSMGGAYAYRGRLRRKSRLQTDIERLDRLRARGKEDPYEAVRDLGAYRAQLKRDLAKGALDDAQFTALSGEAMRLLSALRLRLVGDLEGKLSPRFRHLIEGALEDGSVTPGESEALVAALAQERALAEDERERLARLIASWRQADARA